MRWLIDECVDAALVAHLHDVGHDVVYMSDVEPLVFRRALPVPGIVLMRIDPVRRSLKRARLLAAIERFGDALFGRYTVIEDSRFRSRPLRKPSP